MAFITCKFCGDTYPDFDVAHVCSSGQYAPKLKPKTNEHRYCPNCNANLDGGSIWEHFFKESGSEAEADRIAAMYGATRERGQWGRQVGIYDMMTDITRAWQCPDCKHIWSRV